MARRFFRKKVWDLGGSLNELDSPSHTPDRDVIECVNWRVHKDGRSREKRPGYAEYDADLPDIDDPIIQIHEWEDGNGVRRKIVVTQKEIIARKEVITYEKVWEGASFDKFPSMVVYNGKFIFINPTSSKAFNIRGSEDGETFPVLQACSFSENSSEVGNMVVFNGSLWIPHWSSSVYKCIKQWEEGVGCSEHQIPGVCYSCFSLVVWDGRLWGVFHSLSAGIVVWKVRYYDGTSWSAVDDYDGDAYISANCDNCYSGIHQSAAASLFIFNQKLYLFCSVYDSGEADDTWQVWEWDANAYDNFKKIYDSTDDNRYFVFGKAIEYEGYAYIIVSKVSGDGNDGALYRSQDMKSWEIVKDDISIGHPLHALVFEGRLHVMTEYEAGGAYPVNIYYWDKYKNNFHLEKSLTRDTTATEGSLFNYKGDMFAGTHNDLYKRTTVENSWTTIITFKEEMGPPPSKVVFDDRLLLGSVDSNSMLEGETVYSLGIWAPTDACSGAAANGSQVTNEVPHEGSGTRTKFILVLDNPYIQKSSVTVSYTIGASGHDATDDGKGNISGTECEGSVYYDRGLIVLEFDTAPDDATDIEVDYKWSNLYGDYKYLVTFYRSGNYPCESNPSPESAEVTAEGQKVNLTAIPVSTDPKVTWRRIYRTTAGGAIFFWLVDIEDNSTLIYTDDIHDDSMGDEVSYDRGVPKKGNLYEVWDNRLWIAGNEEYPMMLFYTNTNTAEEMADLNFLAIRRRDGQRINQIKAFGDRLYAFKKESFFEISKSGTSMYEIIEMPQNIGTDAPWSVAKCDKLLIWKSTYGIEVFNGSTCFRPVVSEKIKNTMASINNEYLHTCVGGHNFKDHEYWLTIPTGSTTEPDLNIVFDYLKMSFTTYSFNENLRSFATISEYVTGNLLTLIGTADGNLYILDKDYYDDAGVAISASFKTGWFNVTGEHEMWNILRRMFILYQIPADKTITLKIYTNYNKTAVATISLAGSSPAPDGVERREIMRRLNLGIRGYHVMFEFINNEKVGGICRIMGWNLYFRRKMWKYTSVGD